MSCASSQHYVFWRIYKMNEAHKSAFVRLALLRGSVKPFKDTATEKEVLAMAARLQPEVTKLHQRAHDLLSESEPDGKEEEGSPIVHTEEECAAETEHIFKRLNKIFSDDRETAKDFLIDMCQATEPFADREAEFKFLDGSFKKYGQWGELALRETVKATRQDGLGALPYTSSVMIPLLKSPLGDVVVDEILKDPSLLQTPNMLLQPIVSRLLGKVGITDRGADGVIYKSH